MGLQLGAHRVPTAVKVWKQRGLGGLPATTTCSTHILQAMGACTGAQ